MLGISPFKSTFCLTGTFSGFAPNNARGISPTRTSLDLMATNTNHEDAMMELCRARLISGMMPKFMIHGEYGSGKTHLANRVGHSLKRIFDDEHNLSLDIINIEIGEVTTTTNFEYLFTRMMDAAFPREVLEAALDDFKTAKQNDALAQGATYTDAEYSADLSSIFGKVSPCKAAVAAIHKIAQHGIISEGSVKGYEELREGSTGITNSDQRVRLIDCLSMLFGIAQSRYFLFIVDQANALEDVTNANAKSSWKAATIEMADDEQSAFGWIFVTGSLAQTPTFFRDTQVLTRLGGEDDFENQAITNLSTFNDLSDLEAFFTRLFEGIIDQAELRTRRASSAAGYTAADLSGETFDENKYPFTEESLQKYLDEFISGANPVRTHLQRLNKLATIVVQDGRNFILSSDVDQILV